MNDPAPQNARPGAPRGRRPVRRVRVVLRPNHLEPQFAPLDEPRDGFTAVGRVARPHGLRGELRVATFSPGAPNLRPGRRVSAGGVELTVRAARPATDAWVIAVDGIDDRETVERFQGHLLEVPDEDVARETADSYFVHELIGLRVVTVDGEELGRIVDVLQPGANDVYVVDGPRGEVLIPAIGDVVTSIDLPVSVMIITPLAGLLDGSA